MAPITFSETRSGTQSTDFTPSSPRLASAPRGPCLEMSFTSKPTRSCTTRFSRNLLKRVVQERVGLLVNDISKQGPLGADASLGELGVKSVLCVPLRVSEKVIGAIYLDTRNVAVHFDEDHLQLITAVAGIASLALDNVQHLEWLREENRQLRTEVNLNHEMVGESPRMGAVYELIRRVSGTDSTVLIQGESGTGKELVARAIHASSLRADGPFVAINCAAITETL